MFNPTADLLKSILILSSSPETAGAWTVFVKELGKIRDQHVSENLHFIPSADDFNASTRKNILNGIAICLDVLVHSYEDPTSLLRDLEEARKEAESRTEQKVSNSF